MQRIRNKIASQNVQPVTVQPGVYTPPVQPGVAPPPGGYQQPYQPPFQQNSVSTAAMLKPPPPAATGKDMFLGFLAATGVAIVGGIIWAKVTTSSNMMIGYAYILLGIAIAATLNKVSKSYGTLNAVLSVVALGISLAVGQIFFAHDMILNEGKEIGYSPLLVLTFVAMDPFHWICVALGVFAAIRTARQGP